jgi:nucleoside-diphosphate-sugar epimerase
MAKVFLTNGSGYIGKAVAKAALAKGHEVSALARSNESSSKLKEIGVTPVPGDIKQPENYLDAVRQADIVIHTAATNDADFGKFDTLAVDSIIDALKGTNAAFIYTSGTWVLGDTGNIIADELTAYDSLPIVAFRVENEKKVVAAAAQKIRTVVIRPVIVYGGEAGIIENLVQQAKKTGKVTYIGAGENNWSLVHVDDLADLYLLAIEKAQPGSVYNASTEYLPSKEIAEHVATAAGNAEAKSLSLDEARQTLSIFADAFALDQKIGSVKAKQELGWQPKAPKFAQDIVKTKSLTAGRI